MYYPLEVCPLSRWNIGVPVRSVTERLSLSPASSARYSVSVPRGLACRLWAAERRVYDVWL